VEIQSLEIDFEKDILKINGVKVKTPTVVELPGEGGWNSAKLFNSEIATGELCDCLSVCFKRASAGRP
jgi:hypothetical protein